LLTISSTKLRPSLLARVQAEQRGGVVGAPANRQTLDERPEARLALDGASRRVTGQQVLDVARVGVVVGVIGDEPLQQQRRTGSRRSHGGTEAKELCGVPQQMGRAHQVVLFHQCCRVVGGAGIAKRHRSVGISSSSLRLRLRLVAVVGRAVNAATQVSQVRDQQGAVVRRRTQQRSSDAKTPCASAANATCGGECAALVQHALR
jgi:hypothetical protein